MKYAVGQTHERWTPFVLEDKDIPDPSPDGFGVIKVKSWRPGVRDQQTAPDVLIDWTNRFDRMAVQMMLGETK